jgi:hypothetical protein
MVALEVNHSQLWILVHAVKYSHLPTKLEINRGRFQVLYFGLEIDAAQAGLRLLAFSDLHPLMPRHILFLRVFMALFTPLSLLCPIIDPIPYLFL